MIGRYYAGIDIGGTKMTACIADMQGITVKILQNVKLSGHNRTLPDQAVNLVEEACKIAGIPRNKVRSAGVSTASPFIIRNGIKILASTNLCGGLVPERNLIPNEWTEIPIEETLAKNFDYVEIDNDCIAAAVVESIFGAGRGCSNMVYVTWSTGIGTGLIVDGNILRGKNGNAGHGGHIYAADKGPRCGCGNIADLESLTSGPEIARAYGNNSATSDVFSAYRVKERRAVEVIESAARYFARGLASFNAMLDTEMFILGGSVYLNNEDILLPLIKDEFFRSFPALSKGVRFERSVLESYLGDIAALSLIMPDELRNNWLDRKPWENAPEAVILE